MIKTLLSLRLTFNVSYSNIKKLIYTFLIEIKLRYL